MLVPHTDDAALMARLGNGDQSAFCILADRHLHRVTALATRMMRNPAEAEDVVQECFLRLWRDGASWRQKATVGTWLHRITYNLCLDRLRARKPTIAIEPLDLPADAAPADQHVHDREVACRLRDALDRLPVRQRHAITLVHFQELSGAEAADIMDISVTALESLLSRGRRSLRRLLAANVTDLLGDLGCRR